MTKDVSGGMSEGISDGMRTALPDPILPGSTLGIFGGGQLGRMLAFAAHRLGYRVSVFSPEPHSPAGSVADTEHVASYADLGAVAAFARDVDVITLEFENVPVTALEAAAIYAPVRPGWRALYTAQHRLREKQFLTKQGVPTPPFRPIRKADELELALRELGTPAVLKTAGFGYDGKGQRIVNSLTEATAAFGELDGECILEAFIPFERELSVVGARGLDGSFVHLAVAENRHVRHILDVSLAPADVPPAVAERAAELTREIMEALEVVGVLCTEFFLTPEGTLLVNELAPRPHNSGHLSTEACDVGQFELQLRAVCGLPLFTPTQRPAAMANLLGDLWAAGEPEWAAALAESNMFLYLYGKAEARPGRKMGHLTALAETPGAAAARVQAVRRKLSKSGSVR